MHLAEVDREGTSPSTGGLNFLWLELTNRCNLQCVHCYTESDPWSGDGDRLTADDYESVMRQAYDLGCRRVQLIGGEPQLNPDFRRLLGYATALGFEFVEVFSNLTLLDEDTIRHAAASGVCFATSVYSDRAVEHNAVTGVASSHRKTMANLQRLIDSGIRTRAAVIQVDQDKGVVDRTSQYLTGLGVNFVRHSDVRGFGRGEAVVGQRAGMSGLCGHCWSGKLCVTPDGTAYACVMAREWPAGNVLQSPLAEIVGSRSLAATRTAVFETVWEPRRKAAAARAAAVRAAVDPYDEPERTGEPEPEECPQSCPPDEVTPTCPQSCDPLIVVCEPTGEEEDAPDPCGEPERRYEPEPAECPQSCPPDEVTPTCPQSCDPLIVVCEPTEGE